LLQWEAVRLGGGTTRPTESVTNLEIIMSKPIVLSQEQWEKLKNRLTNDYTPSVMMIRWKMKDVLGFTVREHAEWFNQEVHLKDIHYGTKYCSQSIRLDFYNEPKRTMFILKYSEYLENKSTKTVDL